MADLYPARTRAVRLGLALLAMAGFVALVGAGCWKGGIDTNPTAPEPPLPGDEAVMGSRDYIPPIGETFFAITSSDGSWNAQAEVATDETFTLVLTQAGKEITRIPQAVPVSFSPDSGWLLYTASPTGWTPALYGLRLPPKADQPPRRLTNIDMKLPSGKAFPINHLPTPVSTDVSWDGNTMKYAVPLRGTFSVTLPKD